MYASRTPHGVRELKQVRRLASALPLLRRTPHGVRELKRLIGIWLLPLVVGRTPHGVRELKREEVSLLGAKVASHPSRGA